MKKEKCSLLILFLFFLLFADTTYIAAATNPYNATSSYGTNCTWYAWNMAYEKGGVTLPGWGSAKNWYSDAQKSGYSVGSTPKANSIVVWGDWTQYGHVGYVERVEGTTLHLWDSAHSCFDNNPEFQACIANSVSVETDKACYPLRKSIACEYDLSKSNYTVTGYIYLNVAPQKSTSSSKPTNSTPTTPKETPTNSEPTTKASNAFLKSIELSSGSIAFAKDVFTYNVEVEYEVETVKINAVAEDEKASVKVEEEYPLEVGENEISIKVTAEDKSTKEYKLLITRKEEQQEEKKVEETNIPEAPEEKEKKPRQLPIIIGAIAILLILGIFYFLWKRRKKKETLY